MSRPINYAWDTSVLIAWLSDEKTAPLADIELVVKEIDAKTANLIISATTYSEILESKYTSQQIDLLSKFLQRSNVLKTDLLFKVAKKASEIRDAALKAGRVIRTADAQIIASAIMFEADVLHEAGRLAHCRWSENHETTAIAPKCLRCLLRPACSAWPKPPRLKQGLLPSRRRRKRSSQRLSNRPRLRLRSQHRPQRNPKSPARSSPMMTRAKRVDDPVMLTVRRVYSEAKLSLEELGRRMGYDGDTARKSAWQFLNKTHDPRMSMLRRFAEATGVSLKSLV